MTEKRFTAVIYEDYEKSLFFDNKGEERSLTDYEILNLLNELNEELESKEKAHTRCDELYQKLYDENEQLKSKNRGLQSELQIFKEDATHSNLQINKLADENEQLKSIIDKLTLDNTKMKKVLNTTKKENEELKQILNELSDMLQFDVENGIRSYPVKLSEYLSNALKELQKND